MTRREIYNKVLACAARLYEPTEATAVAERLCADLYGFGRFEVALDGDCEPQGFDVERFDEHLARLESGEPVQYVVGWTEFYGRRLNVCEGVLIPRPETEELVALVVRENASEKPHILDVGTGSGAIAISLAGELQGAQVEALDLSPVAVEVSRENVRLNGVDVDVQQGDIFLWEPLPESYDIIVSNPPYIPEREREEMAHNVTDFEPSEALFVPNESPLVYYERIADIALVGLRKGGKLYFEIHEKFDKETATMLHEMGFEDVVVHNDLNSKPRMVVCRKRG